MCHHAAPQHAVRPGQPGSSGSGTLRRLQRPRTRHLGQVGLHIMVASTQRAPARLASSTPPALAAAAAAAVRPDPTLRRCVWPPVVDEALSADLGFDKEFERFKAAAAQVYTWGGGCRLCCTAPPPAASGQ